MTLVDEISEGRAYDARKVVGYSKSELSKIERLYDISLSGNLRRFLSEMGRSDGGLIGDDPIVLYRSIFSVRGFVLLQSGIQEELYSAGFPELAGKGPFVFSIESETQYFFIATRSTDPESVFRFDENTSTVSDTGQPFLEYLINAAKTRVGESPVPAQGELIVI